MAFQPYGTVWIGRVPFDNSYKHVLVNYSNVAEQKEYFKSVCTRKFDRSSYTYIRSKQSIKVPINAEELYTYNYLMYQNVNYGTKWFYCFITDVVYINANTTELVLELDVWQTWYFDWKVTQCFVEREHVASDGFGEHTNPEPEMPLVHTVQTHYEQRYDNSDWAVIIQRSATNKMKNAPTIWPPDLTPDQPVLEGVDGGVYQGIYSGVQYYYVRIDHNNPYPGTSTVNTILNQMNEAGGGEAVVNIYMVPDAFVIGKTNANGGPLASSAAQTNPQDTPASEFHHPTSLDGYTPRNTKTLCYPYSYCRLYANNGSCADILWEYWTNGVLSARASMDSSGCLYVAPMDYMGIGYNHNAGITLNMGVQCSWNYSPYKNWVAQNHLANAIKFGVNAAMFITPAVKGAATAANVMAKGTAKATSLAYRGVVSGSTGSRLGGAAQRQAIVEGTSAASDKMALAAAGIGGMGLANQAAEYSRMSMQPNVVNGSTDGNSLHSTRNDFWCVDKIVLRQEYARIVDNFFTMYGYQVDRLKKPNFFSRASWNYVKTSNASNHGNVPAPDMALINSILDSGVTIWHTSDIGNYDLDNSIM